MGVVGAGVGWSLVVVDAEYPVDQEETTSLG